MAAVLIVRIEIRQCPSRCHQGFAPASSPASARASAGVLCQPDRQVGWSAEIEQGLCQELKLLERQSLDFGGGGVAEKSAAAVEQAKGHLGLALGFALLPSSCLPFLPSPIQKVLGGAGVE